MAYNLCLVGSAEVCTAMTQLGDEFNVECFELAHQLLKRLRSGPANLLLLDYARPDMPAMELLRVIRETAYGRDLPVIFISPNKTKESLVEAFGLGVDDYLQKPFDNRELQERVRAVLRRRFEAMEQWGCPFSVGKIELDPGQRRCLVDEKRVTLSPLEFAVLEILMRKAGRVLSRSYLLNNIWHSTSSADIRAVDTVVSRLRRALGRRGKMIQTVLKMGYYFKPAPEKGSGAAWKGSGG